MLLKFKISGMSCAACSARVESVTRKIPGVVSAEVNLLAGTLLAEVNEAEAEAMIVEEVVKAGYGACRADAQKQVTAEQSNGYTGWRIVVSAFFLLILMYFTMGHMIGLPFPAWYCGDENAVVAALVQFFLTLPPVLLNSGYYVRGFKALWHRSANMDSLIAIGSGAALVYGIIALFRMSFALGHGDWDTVALFRENLYFESAAMILTLVSFGKYLETRAKGKTGEAIRQLMDLAPKHATVLKDGNECIVPIEDVRVGDLVCVHSGGSIPVDGTVVEGRGAVDQSALTGESVPVEKSAGDAVAAATINTEGYLVIRADKVGEDTTLSQIVQMVEHAGGSKAPIARLADKIAGVFVPVVMGISAITFCIWLIVGATFEFSLTTAISVLVISCPCALGLATPVAIMVGTGRGARMGVLFKNAESLERLHKVNTVVLDKTGTLTNGKPAVTDVLPGQCDKDKLLVVAVSLEQHSEHPFAKAIVEYCKSVKPHRVAEFQTLPGRGVTALIGDVRYYGGSKKLMDELSVEVTDLTSFADEGKTPLYFADVNRNYLGAILAADVLKEDSVHAVRKLVNMNLDVIMLTGDNEKTANAIAKNAGITKVLSDVLPGDKAGAIAKLRAQGRNVLMVGDGINDAPALVEADIGMAIGTGTDVAVESANIVLMQGALSGIVNAIQLSQATIRNIRQNLFWAFFYNCIGIPIAAGVLYPAFGIHLSPMIGAAAMSLSSVFVVTNALRLRFFHSTDPEVDIDYIKEENTIMETIIHVEGMMCPHCKARVESVCKAIAGVTEAVVDLQAKNVTVTGSCDAAALKKAIADAGYEVIE